MRNRKLFLLAIALAFLLSAMGLAFAPASAMAASYLGGDAIPPDPDDPFGSTYVVVSGEISTGTINVRLIIEAGDAPDEYGDAIPGTAFRKEFAVSISDDLNPGNTVNTLLRAIDNNGNNGLAFYGVQGTNLVAFTETTNYLASVEVNDNYDAEWTDGGVAWTYAFNGWVFRVNDKFPAMEDSPDNWIGANILQTPLYDGDVVHLFYDLPSKLSPEEDDLAATFVRAKFNDYKNTTKKLTVQIQGHKTYIDPYNNNQMNVYNYANLGHGVIASLYAADGTTLAQRGQPSSEAGIVTFTNKNLAPGTYIVKTVPSYYEGEDTTFDTNIDNEYFVLTGAYCKITITE
ncbi:MAG: hypothetical protein LBO21_07865 [Synergistaceae bacterium]|jgi:hypothetical protein|nr:hypothetical protein [Synergistaceae bacterium]